MRQVLLRLWAFVLLTLGLPLSSAPKVALFNDTSAWYHWGCTGTSTALKEKMRALGFDVCAIPILETYGLEKVPSFDRFDDSQEFEQFRLANLPIIRTIEEADAVVITGEGTIHDLRFAPRALLYLAHIAKTRFGKHVEIINHSAYPKDNSLLASSFSKNFDVEKEKLGREELKQAQKDYRAVYALLDFAAIREPVSHREMAAIGVNSTLSFDCLPLYIRDHYQALKKTVEKNLVIAGSVAFTQEGLETIVRYMEKMAQQGFKLRVLTGAAAYPAKDDRAFVEYLKTHSKAPFDWVDASSMQEWLDTINQATLLVSGRFHHSIAAFCLETPFIALNSNTHKVHGICEIFGLPEPLCYSDPNLLNQLFARTADALIAPRAQHKEKINELCELAEKNFDGLRAFQNAELKKQIPSPVETK
jgi:polysaccharide pyruvyl transferase WcaK-like protein